MYYVFGLGNPGDDYLYSRHSIGRLFCKNLADAHSFSPWRLFNEKKAITSIGLLDEKKITLVLPEVYMNETGIVVQGFAKAGSKNSVPIIVHDDIDMAYGVVRLSFGSSGGGHKGVTSIVDALGTHNFFRIKIGISGGKTRGPVKRVRGNDRVKKFVLGKFDSEEKNQLQSAVFPKAEHALQSAISLHNPKEPFTKTFR